MKCTANERGRDAQRQLILAPTRQVCKRSRDAQLVIVSVLVVEGARCGEVR